MWGQVGPYNGSLVYGYYLRADQSGGRPQLTWRRYANIADGTFGDGDPIMTASGWGPVRWQSSSRNTPGPPPERSDSISVGVSHWLAALLLLVAPGLALNRRRRARRRRHLGLCSACVGRSQYLD